MPDQSSSNSDSPMPHDTFDQALAGLAMKIANEASEDDVELSARVDAFKALTPYYIGDSKLKNKAPDEDEERPTFDKFRKAIGAVG